MSLSSDERLIGVRAKIERAEHHVRDLESREQIFRRGDPYGLWCEKDTHTGEFVVRAQIRTQVPPAFALIAGDAAHSLRSSLDHLAWQLVKAGGGTPDFNTSFPIHKELPRDERRFARKILGMKPGAIDLIRTMQPYNGGPKALDVLSELDNFDKHRLLYVMACGFANVIHRYRSPLYDQIPGLWDAAQKFIPDFPTPEPAPGELGIPILRDGAEVLRLVWPDGPPLDMHNNLKFTYVIAFAQPEIVERRAIVPLLRQLSDLVQDVVGSFVQFLE